MALYLLVGLGNPGHNYEKTRHNIGFMVADKIAELETARFQQQYKNSLLAKFRTDGKDVVLAKPLTYMNRSGDAVSELITNLKLSFDNLLVILDDFNLPFGKLRIRSKGSDGGHNGLASIIYQLQSDLFPRLRIGIGQENIDDTVKFVLSDFEAEEAKMLPEIIDKAAAAAMSWVREGVHTTMNKFN